MITDETLELMNKRRKQGKRIESNTTNNTNKYKKSKASIDRKPVFDNRKAQIIT